MHYLTYTYDEFNGGYVRKNKPFDESFLQPVMSGRVFAHDYVEHPRGYPTGTLEDEIAAFGVIAVTRLPAGLIGSFLCSPDMQLANELKDMLDIYREGVKPEEMLKPRRRYWYSNECVMEDIADMVTENPIAHKRMVAWFHRGVAACRKRFGTDQRALMLFKNIQHTIDRFLECDTPYQFSLGIDGTQVYIPDNTIIH